ncbi:HDOD domain-containing protein [Aquitalea sp. LB_tupeE]|uniref:HDOD domain-containing protein n=1 Tax=Aquitalea sp. LB_tupeE TaxID=2748078 RepID=UPI0015B8C9DE|nr:HDOD domain-containing protein [Aquitalea sp. LB_tupeE]NWK79419.1 HDOD domain-containing protein [Aquitalea sp. LB_tupeE]
MNRDNNNAEYQVNRRIPCPDGSVLLLCSMEGQRYLLDPMTTPDSHPAPVHGLLAHNNTTTVLGEQPYSCYLMGESRLLSDTLASRPDDRTAAGLLCDCMEALLHLQRHQLTLAQLDAEHILLDSQGQACLLAGQTFPATEEASLQNNVRQAGRLFYRLLTGRPHGNLPLQQLRPDLDPELLQLCQTLLDCHTPASSTSRAALAQLQDWLVRQQRFVRSEGNQQAALQQLLQRMRHNPDFPALSQAINAINHIGNADSERLQVLAEIILKDFSLTNKLLRVVNTANFSQFGGAVSTISRAIVILGFDTIRNLALTLLLFEHMHNRSHAQEVRDVAASALFCGLLARSLARHSRMQEAEEALICGMFQQLGELLCVYYFRNEYHLIHKKIDTGSNAAQAVQHTLGISYAALGSSTAEAWSFPERIVSSLEPYPPGPVRPPQHNAARLRMLGNLAQELTQLLATPSTANTTHAQQLLNRYTRALPLEINSLHAVIAETQTEFANTLHEWSNDANVQGKARQLKTAALGSHANNKPDAPVAELETSYITSAPATTSLLSSGIQEVTSTLLGNYQLNDLLRMILEIMYRAVGFDHVVLCTKDPRHNVLHARFGFGENTAALLPVFKVDLQQQDNAFCIAMERNVDIFIEDANAIAISSHIPMWYRQLNLAQTFIIFPLVLEKRKIGFLYGDKKQAHSLPLQPDELNLLKTLRNQALLAIRQQQN